VRQRLSTCAAREAKSPPPSRKAQMKNRVPQTNRAPLSLHIPEPKLRPGDKPDFSHIKVPQAGEVRRPDINVTAKDTADIAYSLIRVLGEDDKAHGSWDPHLDVETMKRGLRNMVVTRVFDDRMYRA